MKRFGIALLLALAALSALPAFPVYFKEQYYRLYHQHYIQYPDDAIENIYWLERARAADFANPLYAMAKIPDQKHWERYRYLLNMQIELKLIEQHLALGSKFDKQVAYFYNAPWRDDNLESLKIAEASYRAALAYWNSAKDWAAKAMRLRWTQLPEVQFWIDQAYRIETGDLNYERIIGRQLTRLESVRAAFMAMDETTY